MKVDRLALIAAGISLAALSSASVYGQSKPKIIKEKDTPAPTAETQQESSEPDKVRYNRAMENYKHKRYTEERLDLQNLINTYPDSEYLPKAKLAVADSFYQEGGVSNMTQAIAEYKSFVVFFPFDPQAPYAQMQVGMAHYKMMEKADRDTSEALSAEAELQTFIKTYPQSKLIPAAEQRLREVQEVIADGQYRVARFYYLRPDYRASAARLVALTERYPLYSQTDEALWMLGDIYAAMKRKVAKTEDDKNHWADLEAKCYTELITDYPLSPRATQAKEQLKAMGMPIPSANADAAARMRKEQAYQKTHHSNAVMKMPTALLKGSPNFAMAAHSGMPNLNPPEDTISAKDILNPTTAGPTFNLSARAISSGDGETIPDGPVVPGTGVVDTPGDGGGQRINADPTVSSTPSDSAPSSSDPAGANATPATSPTPEAPAGTGAQSDATGTQTGASSAPAASNTPQQAQPLGKNESSSKKKKGFSKLNPF